MAGEEGHGVPEESGSRRLSAAGRVACLKESFMLCLPLMYF